MKTIAFAQAAHEFRNPLNAIIQSLELMSSEIQSNNHYYEVAKNCANLMRFLVNDILDYSQYEQKSLILNYETVNSADLINECVMMMEF